MRESQSHLEGSDVNGPKSEGHKQTPRRIQKHPAVKPEILKGATAFWSAGRGAGAAASGETGNQEGARVAGLGQTPRLSECRGEHRRRLRDERGRKGFVARGSPENEERDERKPARPEAEFTLLVKRLIGFSLPFLPLHPARPLRTGDK